METPVALDRARPQWRYDRRATPWLANGIGGGAGVLVAAGLIAFGIDLYPDHHHGAGWAGFGFSIAAVVIGFALVIVLPTVLESAGIAMVAIGIPAAMGFVVFPRVHHVSDLRLFFAVTTVAWLAVFAFGPARARPLLLALALLMGLTWATVEIQGQRAVNDVPFAPVVTLGVSGSSSGSSGSFTTNPDGSITPSPQTDFTSGNTDSHLGELAGVSTLFAVVYLLGVAVLDTKGRRGIATALVVPGVIATIDAVGFFGENTKNLVAAGLASIVAGLFVGAVGTRSHRRFTVWIGAFGATVGAVLLAGKVTDSTTNGGNSHTGSVFGAFAIGFGLAMIAVAALVTRVAREPLEGDDPPAPRPAIAEPVPEAASPATEPPLAPPPPV